MSRIYDSPVDKAAVFAALPPREGAATLDAELAAALAGLGRKIVILDDDPTGVQTVHGVSVYTTWDEASIAAGFDEDRSLFFILTNSRSLTAAASRAQHRDIAAALVRVAGRLGREFLLVSRSDSTLRGHYPLETETLREVIEAAGGGAFDGEIIMPFFREGERYTIDDTHFIGMGDKLVPAHASEFARDVVFGYRHGNLPLWIEEKTGGRYPATGVTTIGLAALRAKRVDDITASLMAVSGFGKVAVNAVDYDDVKVFVLALARALAAGKRFLFRTAAGFVRVIGGVNPRELLTKADLVTGSASGGLVIIGSHVRKTTEQFAAIRDLDATDFLELDPALVRRPAELDARLGEIVAQANGLLAVGRNAVIYTSRELLKADSEEGNLAISAQVSDALVRVMRGITVKPRYIIAKGGITSSDIGTRGLEVRKALVLGQVLPGVPVWLTGPEARLANVPYIIFPGNVGGSTALREVMEKLR